MKEIHKIIDLKDDQEFVEVFALGDTHFGNKYHDSELFDLYYQDMLKSDNYVVGLGDLMESAVFGSLGEKEQTKTINEQYIKIRDLLKPIAKEDRLLGLVYGNHEKRLLKNNFDIIDLLSKDLNVPNLEYMGIINLNLRKHKRFRNYRMAVAHGRGSGRTVGGKLNVVLNFAKIVNDADVYVIGHLHDKIAITKSVFTAQGVKDAVFGITGAYLKYGGYVEEAMYTPPSRGSLKFKFHFDMDRVSAR